MTSKQEISSASPSASAAADPPPDGNGDPPDNGQPELSDSPPSPTLLMTICIVGIVIGIFGYVSIKAAQRASFAVADIFNEKVAAHTVIRDGVRIGGYKTEDGYTLPHIRGGGDPRSLKNAHRPSRWIPMLFTYSWMISAAILVFVWSSNKGIFGDYLIVFKQIICYGKGWLL